MVSPEYAASAALGYSLPCTVVAWNGDASINFSVLWIFSVLEEIGQYKGTDAARAIERRLVVMPIFFSVGTMSTRIRIRLYTRTCKTCRQRYCYPLKVSAFLYLV